MSRRPAFDPSRLDDELDDLLPPATLGPSPVPSRPPAEHPESLADRTGQLAASADVDPSRSSRGSGGRPPRRATPVPAQYVTVVVAVRIPKPLYDAVVHDLFAAQLERPSYAQVVAWTCEDHRDEVIKELASSTDPGTRAPRGRRLATDVVALTLRFQQNERKTLDDVIEQVAQMSSTGRKITRTAAVIASLRVAVKQGLSPQ